jgi:hypothetical protein
LPRHPPGAREGIKINDANPDGSSQDEINAVNQLKGQSRGPDVLDMGTAFAVKADQQGILAPYRVASWDSIPASSKATDGTYYADYGAIGYNSAKVKTPRWTPRSACNCASRSARCSSGWARPRCSSRTTRKRRFRCPTGSA